MSLTKDGFFKQVDQKTGDNKYVLLGAGGNKEWSVDSSASTLVSRNSNNDIFARLFNTSEGEMSSSTNFSRVYVSNDANIRWKSKSNFGAELRDSGALDGRYLPLSGGWMNDSAQIYWKGINGSTSVYTRMGYYSFGSTNMPTYAKDSHNNTKAFYIMSNGYDAGNDWGGLSIDDEGVSVFGAGDAANNFTGVFRVFNEDSFDDGPQFIVTKASGAAFKYNLSVGQNTVNTNYKLYINENRNAWATRTLEILASNLTSGSSPFIVIGKADSAKNMAWMGYVHNADGGNANRLSFGLHSVDNLLNIFASGQISMFTTSPNAYTKLHINGNTLGTRIWLNHNSNLDPNYSWTNAALTSPTIEIQNYTGTTESMYPTLTLHHYGYGGPRLGSRQGVLTIYGGNTDARTLGSRNSYFSSMKIYPNEDDGLYVNDIKVLLGYRRSNLNISSTDSGMIAPDILGFKNGYPLYTDPEFASGNNSINVYNNSSGSAVTITREISTTSGNSSGYCLHIHSSASNASPYGGGFYFASSGDRGKVYVCIFRALIPSGYSVVWHSNSIGSGGNSGWLTSQTGTGKYEWYAYMVEWGTASLSSTFFFTLNAAANVDWYLSYANVIDITKGNYDGLRTRYSDYANSAGSAGSATTCSYPAGFTSRGSTDWSGVTGTLATDWSVNGADIMFKYDGSKLNVITDGRFYQGIDIYGSSKRVLDEYDISHTKWGDADTLDGYHATNFLAWGGMQSVGSGSPFSDAITFFNNLSNLNNGGKMLYNYSGTEYTMLFTRRSDATAHGSILKWGYLDKYIRIIRMISGSAQSTDWEKISAGYADTAGNADTVDSMHANEFVPKRHSTRFYPFVNSSAGQPWYKVTLPWSGYTSGSNAWMMTTMEIVLGGSYDNGNNGRIYLQYYFSKNSSNGWSAGAVRGTTIGYRIIENEVTIKYDIANPGIFYIKANRNIYNSIGLENITASDTAPGFDFRNTTIEAISESSVPSSANQTVPLYHTITTQNGYWANLAIQTSPLTNTYPQFGSLSVINDSQNNSIDGLVYFRHYSNNDWGLIVDKSQSYTYGVDIRAGGAYALKVGNGNTRLIGATIIGADATPAETLDVRGIIRSTGSGVYLRLGPQNSSYAHYVTNAGTSHWFNKRIDVNGNIWVYGTNYGIASDGNFYAYAVYANRPGNSTAGGVSLYGTSDPITEYGIAFRGTGSYGKFGRVQGDWATYLTMDSSSNRGWIFRSGGTNYASISARGEAYYSSTGRDYYIVYPNGGQSVGNGSSVTGAIAIYLPTTAFKCSTMLKFTIEIYEYSSSCSTTYIVSGYNYSNSQWYNTTAYSLRQGTNGKGNLRVRFGDDGSTRNIIWIGETNTIWSYPQVYIKDITLGHSNYDYNRWAAGWSIGFVTSFGNVRTYIDNPAVNYYANNADYASYSTTIRTVESSTNAKFYFTFVDSNNSSADYEYVYTNGELFYNPGIGAFGHGYQVTASGTNSHAEGYKTQATGYDTHAEGSQTIASGDYSHAEGDQAQAQGDHSHAEGKLSISYGTHSHAEGESTEARGGHSHTEGKLTIASGANSHAEGYGSQATGLRSHAEGSDTLAQGHQSHAESWETKAYGAGSHAEGYKTIAGQSGYNTLADEGHCSHAEGEETVASGSNSHTEGYHSVASGRYSHAENYYTKATGWYSHAQGSYTEANGQYSFASGYYTVADNENEVAFGKYNKSNSDTIFSIGGGSSSSRYNLFEVTNGGVLKVRNSAYLCTNGGNVGIGTTSPSAKLHVAGDIYYDVSNQTYNIDHVYASNDKYIRPMAFSTFGAKLRDSTYLDGRYLPLAGGTMTGTIIMNGSSFEQTGKRWIYGSTRNSGFKYDYNGNESFIISSGTYGNSSISFYTSNRLAMNDSNGQWNATVPDMRIKNCCVSINADINSSYNLYVNGTGYFTGQLHAKVAQGTSPLAVTSTTLVSNLNADLLDGYHASSLFTILLMSHSGTNHQLSVTIGGANKKCPIDYLNAYNTITYGNNGLQYFNIDGRDSGRGTANTNGTPTNDWYHIIRMNHGNSAGYYCDIATCFNTWDLWYRRIVSGYDCGWMRVVDTNNFEDIFTKCNHQFNQYNQGTWTRILQFTISTNALHPTISFRWHPTECARDIWADFNINIRQNDINFYSVYHASGTRILKCVGDGTTFSVWVKGDKSSWDPYGLLQLVAQYGINSYNTTVAHQDSEPSSTYNKYATTNVSDEVPVGTIMIWASNSIPNGWLKCDGSAFSSTEYPELYSVLGGSSYVPNLSGRVPIGVGSGIDSNGYGMTFTINTTTGEYRHLLQTYEIPSHSHTLKDYYYIETLTSNGYNGISGQDHLSTKYKGSAEIDYDNDYLYYYNHSTDSTGGGGWHNNIQPSYGVNFIIKAKSTGGSSGGSSSSGGGGSTVSFTRTQTTGNKIGTITINGTSTDLYSGPLGSGGGSISKNTSCSSNRYVIGTDSTSGTLSTAYCNSCFYFTTTGAYHTSDVRKKYDIKDILNEDVSKLFETENGFVRHFKWINTNKDAYGFIAQELQEYCPEAVDFNNDDGFYAVNYNVAFSKIIGAMFKKIKELENKLKENGIS